MNPNLSQGKRATDLAGNIRDHHRQSTRIRARMLDAVGEFDEGGLRRVAWREAYGELVGAGVAGERGDRIRVCICFQGNS